MELARAEPESRSSISEAPDSVVNPVPDDTALVVLAAVADFARAEQQTAILASIWDMSVFSAEFVRASLESEAIRRIADHDYSSTSV